MRKLLLLPLLCVLSVIQAQTVYILDTNDKAVDSFWTGDSGANLSRLVNQLNASALTIDSDNLSALDLTSVTGILGTTNGGTGVSALNQINLTSFSSAGVTIGKVPVSNGSGGITWETVEGGSLSSLPALSDVNSDMTPGDGSILVWDSGNEYWTSSSPVSAFGFSLIHDADAAAAQITLSLVPGVNVQQYDADLDDLADGSLTGSKVGSGIDAANITTGTIGTARLGSGTANSTTFLRGDNTWQTLTFGDAFTTSSLSQFAATTSAELAGVLSDETGMNKIVLSDSPILVTPNLGTPSVLTLTNATGLPWATGIADKPTSIAGYGILDPIVLTSGSYADPAWITSLAWNKLSGVPGTFTPTAHTHDWGDIEGDLENAPTELLDALDAKLDASAVSAFGSTLIDDANALEALATLGIPSATGTEMYFPIWGAENSLGDSPVYKDGDWIQFSGHDVGQIDYLRATSLELEHEYLDQAGGFVPLASITASIEETANWGGDVLQIRTAGSSTAGRMLRIMQDNDTIFSVSSITGNVFSAGSFTGSGAGLTGIPLGSAVTGTLPVASVDFGNGTDGHVWTSNGDGTEGWQAVAGTGTVTSVAVSGSDGIEVDSGSPITASGTIALGLNKSSTLTFLNVEDGADVTDTTNVTAAGALMDSEVNNLLGIKTLTVPDSTTISVFAATVLDDSDADEIRTTLNLDVAGTDNSTNVTLAGSLDYITLSGQQITRNAIDLSTDVTGTLPGSGVASATTSAAGVVELATDGETSAGVVVQGNDNRLADAEKVVFVVPCSDNETAVTTGAGKGRVPVPFSFTLTGVKANAATAPTGSTFVIDINEGGVSVLSTELTIDATEITSTTAATPAVISDSAIADDAVITIDFDQVGATVAGAGIVVTLYGTR